MRAVVLAVLLALPAVAEAPVSFGTIEIEVKGISAISGTLNVGVHDKADTFPDGSKAPYKATAVKVVSNPQIIVIEKVPYGVHAVSVWHDLDGDGVMKKGLFGIPKEPIGVSKNVHPTLGPPSFDDAKFELQNEKLKLAIEVFVP
jgi:uncharacterized protein (DUF2141 family)